VGGRPSVTAAVAALWHALAAWSKLFANRKLLRDDSRYRCELRVTGTVAGYPVDESLNAWLTVGSPSLQASAHAIPTAELVAWMWDQIPATRRPDLQDQLAAYWAEHQDVPGLDEAKVKNSKLWLARLRATVQKEREGPISLDCDGDPQDLSAAEERFAA
jgi:hypothetical protein